MVKRKSQRDTLLLFKICPRTTQVIARERDAEYSPMGVSLHQGSLSTLSPFLLLITMYVPTENIETNPL